MVYSMTGYGKTIAELPNKKVTIEIKTLNSKQFDLYTRIPAVYREQEISLRNLLARRLNRGKIDLSINAETISKDISARIDHRVVKQYQQEIRSLSATLGVSEPSEWFSVLFRLPDVMKPEMEEPDEQEWTIIEKAIEDAIDGVVAFRQQEGVMLAAVLTEKIGNIRSLLGEVEPFEKERIEKIRERIVEELEHLEGVEYDKSRFEQEMIYYIEKLDISEEKNRLTHHLDYFTETMRQKEPQGKKLGFIAQEIGREINTLGSKSHQSEMQRIVVRMKDELEQIKEQILNIL